MAKVAQLLERIVPKTYRLKFDVNMEAFSFKGTEEIEFELLKPGRELVLHAVRLEIMAAELGPKLKATDIRLNEAEQTVTFGFDQEVKAGPHTLKLEYSGEIQDSLHGFYRSRYEHEGREKWLATTQFEAVHAREAFVCVDEPSAKAVFEMSLTVPDQLSVIANTNILSEEPGGPTPNTGRKTVHFAPTPKMSTYLVAFVVGEFEYIEGSTPEGVAVRIYATPGRKGQLGFALDTAVRTLSFYNEYFGIPYPLPKLDMIAVPDFSVGAMENWGAVTYREVALLLDPAKTSLSNKQRVAEVITHELAHQWFGNLVTMAWWNDLWLNEGFASWMEVYAKDSLFPEWDVWTEFVNTDFAYSMDMDGLANTHPIQVEVDDPRALDEVFDAVSYYKGSSIINMLHHYLGADDFREGLRDYLKKHSYGNTVTHDLWAALARASGKPVDEIMSAWTSQPGYPLVSYDNGELTQRRFYSSPREAAKAKLTAGTVWPIPFGAMLEGGQETPARLVTEATTELPHEVTAAKWFKPNPGQTGFYRSLYTEPMIAAITKPLKDGTLGATDRFGVVDDVFAAIQAGEMSSEVGLELVEALREEANYIVWVAVAGGFGSLEAVVEDEPLREQLDRFGRWLVMPNVERLGWEAKEGEPAFDTLMRPMVLQQAIRYDDEATTREARKRLKAFLEGQPLNPDLRPVVLFAAARHGGTEEFEVILQRYRTEDSPQVKIGFLAALGRFRKPALIKRFLEFGVSEEVRPQDIYIVLAWGMRNREARELTWEWVRKHWGMFLERYGGGGHMLDHFPTYVGAGFATHERAAEIKAFFEAHPHPAIVRPTAQAVEAVELKADWYDRDKLKIRTFADKWETGHKS
jgi:puromycin-sensitive aminopeptidase